MPILLQPDQTKYPDAEALVYSRLSPIDETEYQVWAVDTQNNWPHVLDQVVIQVDVRSESKKKCRDAAWVYRDWLLTWQHDTGTPVTAVNLVNGPRWLPDPDGTPRYVTQVQVALRQNQTVTT